MCRCFVSHVIVDGDGAQAVQEEQQGRMHVVKQVPGLVALGAQREADLGGPAGGGKASVA